MLKIRHLLTVSAFLVVAHVGLLAGSDTKEDQPIELPPFRVYGSFSEVSWAARFRYHIPGKALKALIFTKLPSSWAKQGISNGDVVEAIDGVPVDGRTLPVVIKQLESKRASDAPLILDVRLKASKQIQKVEVVLKKDSSNITIHYP
jgi:hypothetical protein